MSTVELSFGGKADVSAGGLTKEAEGAAQAEPPGAALMQMVTPDFTQRMPDGQIIPYEIAEAGLKEWFATADRVTDYAVQIGALTVKGNEAVATVEESVAMTFADPNGRPHERVPRD